MTAKKDSPQKRGAANRRPRSPARGPALDEATTEKLLAAIRTGLNLDVACEYVGIPRSTFFLWVRKGRQEGGGKGYREFVGKIDVALAEFEARQIAGINKAGDEEWQARAWLLERKFPDRYGRRTRVDSNVTLTATPVYDTSSLTLAEKHELARLLRKISPAREQLSDGQVPALQLLPGDDKTIEGEAVEE